MPVIAQSSHSAPSLLNNPHLATVVPHLVRLSKRRVPYVRERLETPDGDFFDADWARIGSDRLAIVSHGLASSSSAAYVQSMVRALNQAGWDAVAVNQRCCSGESNRKIHFFTGGDSGDIEVMVNHALAQHGYSSIALIGFSMGGNVSLLYMGHHADRLPPQVKGCVTFSVPLDMGATADHLANNTLRVYMYRFLNSYREKMRAKAKLMPGVFDLKKVEEVKNFREFDAAFNCPWLGFAHVDDFYHSISSMHALDKIKVPTLVVQAKNDPFLPPECFPVDLAARLEHVWLEMPDMGGHIGFYGRGGLWAEQRAVSWLTDCVTDGPTP